MKKSTLISIILISLIATGIGGYFLINELVMNSLSEKVKLTSVSIPEEIMKGNSLTITFELSIEGKKGIVLESISLGIESVAYSLNGTAKYNLQHYVEGDGKRILVLSIGPLLNTSVGLFALNSGEFRIYSFNLTFEGRIPKIAKALDNSFSVINGIEEEQLANGKFQEELDDWGVQQSDGNVSVSVVSSSPLEEDSLLITNIEEIPAVQPSWVNISQTLDLTQTHFIAFEQSIVSTNCSFEIFLFIDNIKTNMSLILNETSTIDQIIHYGYAEGVSTVTLQIVFNYADNATELYLDNLSVLQYEHRVFVVALNDNWEIIVDEIGRDSPSQSITNASYYFERELGIKLIPIIELSWNPADVSMAVVDELALEAAGEKLSLNGTWKVAKGKSDLNHGFDLLTGYSNRTSEHYGFAYYTYNVAFHFGQSEELGEYSWITIVNDFAENLIQHEISHNFGAHDRNRTFWPPSVMSKPSTPDQVVADLVINKLWLMVNNWLIEDILIMLEYRAMFD